MATLRQNATDGDILRFLAAHEGRLTPEQVRFGLAERQGLRATVERIRRVMKGPALRFPDLGPRSEG